MGIVRRRHVLCAALYIACSSSLRVRRTDGGLLCTASGVITASAAPARVDGSEVGPSPLIAKRMFWWRRRGCEARTGVFCGGTFSFFFRLFFFCLVRVCVPARVNPSHAWCPGPSSTFFLLPLTLVLLSRNKGNFHAFDLDDVDAAFSRFKTLKFSQHLTFSVRLSSEWCRVLSL